MKFLQFNLIINLKAFIPRVVCVQILANLVMETLHPDIRNMIVPRLKGKMQQRQKNWMLVSFCQSVQ